MNISQRTNHEISGLGLKVQHICYLPSICFLFFYLLKLLTICMHFINSNSIHFPTIPLGFISIGSSFYYVYCYKMYYCTLINHSFLALYRFFCFFLISTFTLCLHSFSSLSTNFYTDSPFLYLLL